MGENDLGLWLESSQPEVLTTWSTAAVMQRQLALKKDYEQEMHRIWGLIGTGSK